MRNLLSSFNMELVHREFYSPYDVFVHKGTIITSIVSNMLHIISSFVALVLIYMLV